MRIADPDFLRKPSRKVNEMRNSVKWPVTKYTDKNLTRSENPHWLKRSRSQWQQHGVTLPSRLRYTDTQSDAEMGRGVCEELSIHKPANKLSQALLLHRKSTGFFKKCQMALNSPTN